MRLRTLCLPVAAISLAATLPATAATPESGTVSASSPTVAWEGTAKGYGVFPTNLLLTTAGQEPAPCEAPYCDTFALKVADKADLNLFAAQRGQDNFTELHVIKPDGEKEFAQSGDAEPVRIKIKGAVPGDYTIEVLTNESMAASGEYDASATLAVAGAPSGGSSPSPSQPPPNPGAPPQPQPQPGQQPSPSSQPAASLSLVTKTVSSRKAKKRFKLAIGSSKPVTDVKLAIKKGKKIVGKGALKALNGKGKLTVKGKKKLKRGTYTVVITAKDGAQVVGLTTRLKVKK